MEKLAKYTLIATAIIFPLMTLLAFYIDTSYYYDYIFISNNYPELLDYDTRILRDAISAIEYTSTLSRFSIYLLCIIFGGMLSLVVWLYLKAICEELEG